MYCDRFANLRAIRYVANLPQNNPEVIYIPFVEVHEAIHIRWTVVFLFLYGFLKYLIPGGDRNLLQQYSS